MKIVSDAINQKVFPLAKLTEAIIQGDFGPDVHIDFSRDGKGAVFYIIAADDARPVAISLLLEASKAHTQK